MPPSLGQSVLYVPLASEPAQSFVAATNQPVGEAVVQPVPYPQGFRAATVVGIAGQPVERRVSLLVYKQPGDPFRGDGDAFMQRLNDVPYSEHGVPGTWTHIHGAVGMTPATAAKAK